MVKTSIPDPPNFALALVSSSSVVRIECAQNCSSKDCSKTPAGTGTQSQGCLWKHFEQNRVVRAQHVCIFFTGTCTQSNRCQSNHYFEGNHVVGTQHVCILLTGKVTQSNRCPSNHYLERYHGVGT